MSPAAPYPVVQTALDPRSTYLELVGYGRAKVSKPWYYSALAGVAGGLWVGLYGHCCQLFAGKFYRADEWWSIPVCVLVYSAIFPGAFAALIFTSTDLFTSLSVALWVYVFEERWRTRAWLTLLRIWVIGLIGNFFGACLAAGMFSVGGNQFHPSGKPHEEWAGTGDYLCYVAEHKIVGPWYSIFFNAIGCNMCVCLATFSTLLARDTLGKIAGAWFPVFAFASAGFQHIVANFYTVSAGLMTGCNITWGDAFLWNWFPTLLGNLVAGALFTGTVWWYMLGVYYDHTEKANENLHIVAKKLTSKSQSKKYSRQSSDTIVKPKRDFSAAASLKGGSFLVSV